MPATILNMSESRVMISLGQLAEMKKGRREVLTRGSNSSTTLGKWNNIPFETCLPISWVVEACARQCLNFL